MTPREKAEELVGKYSFEPIGYGGYKWTFLSKQCALIAVDEIISSCLIENINYWRQVKQEIEKL